MSPSLDEIEALMREHSFFGGVSPENRSVLLERGNAERPGRGRFSFSTGIHLAGEEVPSPPEPPQAAKSVPPPTLAKPKNVARRRNSRRELRWDSLLDGFDAKGELLIGT